MAYFYDADYSQNDQYFDPIQPFLADSSYDHNNYRFMEYHQTPYYDSYIQYPIQSTFAYSASISSAPLFIEYNQTAPTQLTVSYALMEESNTPDFEEYDPTPFGGGYDPNIVYGKPLPPSDDICYPRSTFNSISVKSDDYGKERFGEDAVKPHIESKPATGHGDQQTLSSSKEQPGTEYEDGCGNELVKPSESDHDYKPLSCGSGEEPVSEYENSVPQVPSGYGLEAMDICESLFGYWPCLSRVNKNCNAGNETACEINNGSLGSGAADYLFGSSNPYERRAEGTSFGTPIYGYERHYQEQPLCFQVAFDEVSSLPRQGYSALFSEW